MGFVCVCLFWWLFLFEQTYKDAANYVMWTDAISGPFTIALFFSESKSVC